MAIFSVVNWATLPATSQVVQKQQLNNFFSSNYLMASNFTSINLSDLGQSVSVRATFKSAPAPWHLGEAMSGSLVIVKTYQNLSFPFTDSEILISSISVYANGINTEFSVGQISTETPLNGTRAIVYSGTFHNVPDPNSINLTITYFAQIVLISGIYHFSGKMEPFTTQIAVP